MENPTPPTELEALLAEEPFLRNLASSLLEGEVDDLVQETYLRAMEKGALQRTEPRPWLGRILRNLVSNMRRGRFRARAREARAAVHDRVPSSAELVEREESRRALLHAVQGLDEVHRRVILLRYFEGLDPRMIAKRLEVPVATVWNRLRRGLELLRKHLDSEHGGDRRAWALPLTPLATHGIAIPGAVIMSSKLKVAAIAVLLVTFVGGVMWTLQGSGDSEGGSHPLQLEPISLAENDETVEAGAAFETMPDRSPLASRDLPATTGTLNLTVIYYGDDKSPAAAVGLDLYNLSSQDALNPRIRIRTDYAGRARVEELDPGSYALWPDLKSSSRRVEILAGEETEFLFKLNQGLNIEGIVLDLEERPVTGAEISLNMYAMTGDAGRVVTTTREDGRFSIRGTSSGFTLVSARAEGFASSEAYRVSGEEGSEIEMRIYLIAPGGGIHGQVLDPMSQPVAGARIRFGYDGMNGHPATLHGGVSGMQRRATEVFSDAQGRFEVHGMPLGANPINLRAAGLAPWSGHVQVNANRSAEVLIHLQPGVELSGTMLNPSGDPIAGVPVQVGNPMKIAYFHTRTSADGGYRIKGLPTGEILIRAGDEQNGVARTTLSGKPGESLTWNAELGLGIKLLGVVLDREGNPVQGALVIPYLATAGPVPAHWPRYASTNSEGEFTLTNCPLDRKLKLRVEVKGQRVAERTPVDPREGEVVIQLDVDIRSSVHIRGAVADSEGRPLGNAEIRAARSTYKTDPLTGAFNFGPLLPGRFQLRINAAGHPRFISEERELFANEVWDLGTIRIPAGGTLHAKLHYPAGGTLSSSSLLVQEVDGDDYYGSYRATDSHTQMLVSGSYRLVVRGSGVAYRVIPFEIQAGETTELTIDIERGLRRDFGLNLPPSAQGEQQVEITISTDDGIVLRRTVSQVQGEFETHATFALGDYTIEAKTGGGLKGSSQFTVEAGQETVPRIRVRLR